jgi:tetratricopeptide (TPR) repeat protein
MRTPFLWNVAIAAAAALAALPRAARADEIVVQDPETCERQTVKASEIVSETWVQIQYREKERGPLKTIPTADVVEIRRDTNDQQAARLTDALEELRRGNVREAREALQIVNGGGWKVDSEGRKVFVAFNEADAQAKGKRPSWVSEYSQFFYARALVKEGLADKKNDLLEEALLALDDRPVPGGDAKKTSGGFLKRFKDGNSRWYPEALMLDAQALTALGRYDDAAKRYDELYGYAASLPIGPRWAYEAKVGAGEIAEAQGKPVDAVNAYVAAADVMRILLEKETHNCARREIGRYYSKARMKGAEVKLHAAEEHRSKAEFADLRKYIEDGSPDAIRQKFAGRPKAEIDAVVAGARDPYVQAVAQNGLGLAYLNEGAFEEAVLAFRGVDVKYFQVPEEPARALYYLSQAADGAAKQAKGEGAKYYEALRDEALKSLRTEHPDSPFAKK